MGDGLAVEIAQQSHFNLLPQLGDCMKEHEVVAYRRPIPRGPFYEFLTVDDHIGLQRLDKHVPFCDQQTRDVEKFLPVHIHKLVLFPILERGNVRLLQVRC